MSYVAFIGFVERVFFVIVIITTPVYLNQHFHQWKKSPLTPLFCLTLAAWLLFMPQFFYDAKILQFLLTE